MKKLKQFPYKYVTIELGMLFIAGLFLIPFYFIVSNSLKAYPEIVQGNLSLPEVYHPVNYIKAFIAMKFHFVVLNNIIITTISVIGIVIISSMAAYRIVRAPNAVKNFIFLMLLSAMIIPFQTLMLPLANLISRMDLIATRTGLILCYFGFGIPLSTFLFHGFIKGVPKELEESAIIDGCGQFTVFWKIVFPLLKSVTITVIILNSFWIWNDFLLPFILNSSDPNMFTIPLATYQFFGLYATQWDLVLPALVLGITPMLLLFLYLQRYLIEGIVTGALKG